MIYLIVKQESHCAESDQTVRGRIYADSKNLDERFYHEGKIRFGILKLVTETIDILLKEASCKVSLLVHLGKSAEGGEMKTQSACQSKRIFWGQRMESLSSSRV